MCLHNGLDIQPLLVAEVIVHGRDIRAGPLADVANRRAIEAALGKDFTGCDGDSLAGCVRFRC
jgi:hypothetical protein